MELYWWWIQSGSLFTAYLFGCCIVAAMIVYGLNELYLEEIDSKDQYPYHAHSYFNPQFLSWYARKYPDSVIQDSILLDYSKLDSKASLKFLASRHGARMPEPYYIEGPAINRWNEFK